MSQITGTFVDNGVARARVPIKFTFKSSPAIAGTLGVTSRVPVETYTNEVGYFSQALAMGNYEMEVDGHDRFLISVPNDSATYDFVSRIVGDVTQSPETPLAIAGVWIAQNETALKNGAPASSANRFAILYSPATAGKNFWRWDASSSAAESTTVINPAGNTGDGRWLWVDHLTSAAIATASVEAVETIAAMKALASNATRKVVMVTNRESADYAEEYSFIFGNAESADGYAIIAPDDNLGRFFAR